MQLLTITEMTIAAAQVIAEHHQALIAKLGPISLCSSALLQNCTALRLGSGCAGLQELSDNLSAINTTQVN